MQPVEVSGDLICPDCRKILQYVEEPCCLRCGKEVAEEGTAYCQDCSRMLSAMQMSLSGRRLDYERGISVFRYRSVAAALLRFKYKNKREYADFFAEEAVARYANVILHEFAPDALVPVPVHWSRRLQRGYNQAELVAEGIGSRLGIRVEPHLLRRNRKTTPQKKLGPAERLANLREAFVKGAPERGPMPECVLLIDDVYTTGSTARACSGILKRMGVKRVYVLTMAIGSGTS